MIGFAGGTDQKTDSGCSFLRNALWTEAAMQRPLASRRALSAAPQRIQTCTWRPPDWSTCISVTMNRNLLSDASSFLSLVHGDFDVMKLSRGFLQLDRELLTVRIEHAYHAIAINTV